MEQEVMMREVGVKQVGKHRLSLVLSFAYRLTFAQKSHNLIHRDFHLLY